MKNHLPKLITFLLLTPFLVSAAITCPDQPCPKGQICIPNPLCANTFPDLINTIATLIFNLALWIAPIMYIIAGFYFLTAAGDPKKIQTAKQIILYTTIGLIVVISAKGLIALFKEIFMKK